MTGWENIVFYIFSKGTGRRVVSDISHISRVKSHLKFAQIFNMEINFVDVALLKSSCKIRKILLVVKIFHAKILFKSTVAIFAKNVRTKNNSIFYNCLSNN